MISPERMRPAPVSDEDFTAAQAITAQAKPADGQVHRYALTAELVLGVVTARRRDFTAHRAWMIRGYAVGIGVGTQLFTQPAWLVASGPFTPASRTGTMAAARLIDILVSE
ncbi:DUF2306 domain-containing protein [Actinoplanes derwentensis]|uniref:DUF2306 domain-containing protein n=1 Tax=Actinoplanes derwentensis TaxID=113562 RepID=UPI0012FE66E1|nr:DUF2306 domain-containing protein [Actinoplanes derwentensis]